MQTTDEREKRVMSATQTLSDHAVTDSADERWKVRELRAIGRIMDLGKQPGVCPIFAYVAGCSSVHANTRWVITYVAMRLW